MFNICFVFMTNPNDVITEIEKITQFPNFPISYAILNNLCILAIALLDG